MFPVVSNRTPRLLAVMMPVAACVMSPAACNRTVLLAPEPVVTAWFSVSAPDVTSVMFPALEATPVTVFVNMPEDATTPVCNVPVVASLNTIVPAAAVSCTAIVPVAAFVPTTFD